MGEAAGDLLRASAEDIALVEVPPRTFLAVDGVGDPGAGAFSETMHELSAVADRLAARGLPPQGPPEALFHEGDRTALAEGRRKDWEWTLLIPAPDEVADDDVAAAVRDAERDGAGPITAAVRRLELDEGEALQLLHVGPFTTIDRSIERLHAHVAEQGYALAGPHHEIYLTDPDEVATSEMRTILRQPVRPA